jgi:FAD/FMN-containing dehydrogenase
MWKNWSGYVDCPRTPVLTPDSGPKLAQLLADATRDGQSVRMVGAGHSFSPLVASDGVIVSLDKLQGIIDVDASTRVARVHAGTRLYTLGAALAQRGLAMENLGDIDVQSIAGATSTGTHGTGLGFGNLATQVAALKFVTADGREIVASPTENPPLFDGGRIALGSLGVLIEVSLRLVPAFRLRLERGRMDLEDCLAQADALVAANRSFEFYWLPHTETVLTKKWNTTDAPVDRMGFGRWVSDVLLENTAFGFLCDIGKAVPSLCPPLSELVDAVDGAPGALQRDGVVGASRARRRCVARDQGPDRPPRVPVDVSARSPLGARRRHLAEPQPWPRQRAHLRAPVSRHAVRSVLRRRAGDLPEPRRAAPLGQGAFAEGGATVAPLSALGRLHGAAREDGSEGVVPDALRARVVRGLSGALQALRYPTTKKNHGEASLLLNKPTPSSSLSASAHQVSV